MLESQLQSKLKVRLEKLGWYVIRFITASKSGYPDLLCKKSGVNVWVEVKQPGKKPTPLQEHRHNELREQGDYVIIASSMNHIDAVEACIPKM